MELWEIQIFTVKMKSITGSFKLTNVNISPCYYRKI